MKNGLKRLLSWLIALVLVVSLLPAALPVADAAGSLTVSDANIGLSWSDASNSKGKASWSASGDNVTGTATGYTQYIVSKKTITTTLTITNNHSDSRTLQFSFTLSGGGSVSGIISGTSGNYSAELGAGASVTITLTSPSGSSTNTLSLTGIQLLGNSAVSSTFKAPVNGSYTVDGTAITADTVLEKVATESYALEATPASGYKFYGWWSNTSSSYVSTLASASLKFAADPQLEPKFIPADQALFSVGGMTFATLTEAGAYAATSTNKTIIPISNGTVYGSHTIPAGVTLLVPFDSGNTLYTTEPDCTSGFLNNVAWVQPTPYRTLTLDSTANITVNGAISVSAQHAAANGGKDFCGAPTGPCGFMAMESGSKITLNNGAKLYAWGFITGAGTIDALSGSTVYENFQFADFRGGTVTTDLAEAKTSFPMSQYYVQNIEVPITFYQGSVESLYTSVFMSQMCPHGAVTFIGTGGLFIPGQGGYVTKTYDGSRDRMVFDVYENATINSISMTLSGTTVNSADYLLPINGNIDINIHSGVGTMAQSIALLPGTTITVDQGATINLASTSTATTTFSKGYNVVLYDYDQWMGGGENVSTGEQTNGNFVFYNNTNAPFGPVKYAPGKKYTRTNADLADAKVDINGTIQANGYVYSTLGGANVTSSQGTGRIVFANGAGTDEYVYEAIQTSNTYVPVRNKLIPALLKNADGSFTETAGAQPGDTFVYDLTTGKWVKEGPFTVTWKDDQGNTLETDTVEKNTVPTYDGAAPTKAADANGHYTFSGWTPAVTAATADTTYTATFTTESHSMSTTTVEPGCEATGSVTHTCTVCGYTTSETTDALGHSYSSEVTTAPTCTEAGVKTFTCATCGHSYTEAVAATGHVNTTTTTVEATCTVDGSVTVTCDDCGTTISSETIAALGHSYSSEVTTAPTCTETGVKTYTCTACGHSYTEIVAATGHVDTTTETVEPTCTEAGSTTVTCACGEVVSVTEIPATGHVNTTTTTVDATCTENGSVTVTCDDCGEVLSTETVDALGHSYDEGVVTAPTCTEGGYTTFTCTVCGHTEKGEETEATGHVNTTTETVEPTCTEAGSTTVTCTCGEVVSVTEIPATGHVNTTTTTVDATCTENGTVTVTCDDCGEVLSTETIDALGHSYDEGVVTAPTCTEGGYTTFTCTVCGHTEKGEETEATGHDYTYTDNGDTHTITCLNGCDYSLTEGHTYTDGSCICGAAEHVAAVTDSEGNTVTYASLMEAIVAAEAGDTVSLLKDITLEERIILDAEDDIILDLNGKTLTTCGTADNYDIVIKGDLTICDSSEEQTGTLVVPGIYGIGVSTTAGSSLTIEGGNFTQIGDYYLIGSWGTVTISGGSFYAPYCTVNAFSGTAYISGGSFRSDASDSILLAGDVVLTGGSYDRDVQEFCADEYIAEAGENETYTVIPCVHTNTTTETVDPTCTETGSVTVTCDDCGEVLSTETVDALGHSYDEGVVTAPTCTEGGYTTFTCSVCGHTEKGEETEATDHDYTYTDNGDTHTITCLNGCDYSLTEGHTYINGSCICGAVESAEPDGPAQLELKLSHSVNFDSDLKMNYRVKYSNLAAAIPDYVTEGAYLVVEKDRYPVSGGVSVETVTLYPDLESDPDRMVFRLSGIQSVEMGSELRAVLHIFDQGGNEYVTPVDVYSVLAYAQLCYDSYTYEAQPELYGLLIDTLNYGTAAQYYFCRRTDTPVNAGMDAYQQYATTELSAQLADEKHTETTDRSITAVSKIGFSVNFDDRTEINAKLTIADGYSKEDITSVQVLNEAGQLVETVTDFELLTDGRLQATFYGVKSVNMRDMFYFVAYVGDEIASDRVGYSVEAYAKSNISSSNANLAEMVLKCMYYGDSAYAYFNR